MAMTDLEHTAMERLRLASSMSLKLYKQPLLLTDSGGKDSAVICRLAENAGIPFEICHSHTTADAPETVYHVRKRAKEYEARGIIYTIRYPTYKVQRTSMWALIPQKLMPPTRVMRYCCDVLKESTGKNRWLSFLRQRRVHPNIQKSAPSSKHGRRPSLKSTTPTVRRSLQGIRSCPPSQKSTMSSSS